MRSEIRGNRLFTSFPQGLVQPHVKVPFALQRKACFADYTNCGEQCLGAREVGRRRSSWSEKINPDQC
ncbi:hypothetical protein CEXT_678431 [Caerostris extrusa]|uniref:Uncharacterized protein n=1 Tax=Caerostris extrusa TaxID=172846 RepID=A0AAV4U9E9_CAEEX|nr:hypothetical protein CEXT_678431 [Caerostris extrusa]